MNLWFDLKYAWRLSLKAPGYSVLCILVVALSVGLALFSFEMAYSQALKPIGFPGAELWYSLQAAANATSRPTPNLDAYTYQEIRKRSRTVDFLGAFSSQTAVLSEGEASNSLRAAAISPKLLAAMRVPPHLGRLFDDDDARPGAPPTVILDFDSWHNYFAADPHIVGRLVRLDGQAAQIIGVMPDDATFYDFQNFELWRPLQLDQLAEPGASALIVSAIVAVAKDRSVEALLSEIEPVVEDVNRTYPDIFNPGRHLALIPVHRMSTHQLLPIIAAVNFIALAVLLLGCVDISLIFYARLLERSSELALRTALGSSRLRLLRQCVLETALIVLIGLLGGVGLAALGIRWGQGLGELVARVQGEGRVTSSLALRSGDLAAAVVAAAVIWLLSTLIPAWRIAKHDAAAVLAGGGKGIAAKSVSKGVGALVSLQVVISSLVLVLCMSIVFAARDELKKPTGLSTGQVMLSTYPTEFDTRQSEAAERLRYWDELSARIRSRIPGVEIAYSSTVPTRPGSRAVAIEHQEGSTHQGTLTLPLTAVSEDYFRLLGVSLRAGRLFNSGDDSSSLQVAVVDENTVRRYWPAQDVLGKRLRALSGEDVGWLTVVGVTSAVRRPYDREFGVVYRPLRQALPGAFHVLARVPASAANGRAALQAAAFEVDRDLPLHNLQRLDAFLEVASLNAASLIPVFTVIAAITLILAATGLFGLISRSVAARTQEVGVRRALGSSPWQVTRVFLRQGTLYASVGVVGVGLGILVATLISSSIPNILNEIAPVTAGVLILMAGVIFLASYLPTRRAVALEPGDALRYE